MNKYSLAQNAALAVFILVLSIHQPQVDCFCTVYVYPDGSCKPTCDQSTNDVGTLSTDEMSCTPKNTNNNNNQQPPNPPNTPNNQQPDASQLTPQQQQQAQAAANSNRGAVASQRASIAISTIITPSNPAVITSYALVKMFEYIRYLDIPHSTKLDYMYTKYTPSSGDIDTPKTQLSQLVKNETDAYSAPKRFGQYGLSSSFLIGYWAGIFSISIYAAATLTVIGLEILIKLFVKKPIILKVLTQVRLASENYLLSAVYAGFGDMVLYAGLNFNVAFLASPLARFSLALAIFFLIVCLAVLVGHVTLINRYQQIKKRNSGKKDISEFEQFKEKLKAVSTLFDSFRDETALQQAFLFIMALRSISTAFFLVVLMRSATAQIILFFLFSLAMIAYLVKVRPFKNLVDFIQQLSFEIMLLMVNICFLIAKSLELRGKATETAINNLGDCIIGLDVTSKYLPLLFLAVRLIIMAVEQFKKFKEGKESAKKEKAKAKEETPDKESSDAQQTEPLKRYISSPLSSPTGDATLLNDVHIQLPGQAKVD